MHTIKCHGVWWPGCSAVVQELWRWDVTSPFPPSGNEGYIHNRDVSYQSVTPSHVGWQTNWDPYQRATDTVPSSVLWKLPAPLYLGVGLGLPQEDQLLYYGTNHSVRLDNTENIDPSMDSDSLSNDSGSILRISESILSLVFNQICDDSEFALGTPVCGLLPIPHTHTPLEPSVK